MLVEIIFCFLEEKKTDSLHVLLYILNLIEN